MTKMLPEKRKIKESVNLIDESQFRVEEASEFEEGDYFEIKHRPRIGKNTRITYIFNPINEKHWIKEHFFDIFKKRI